MAEDRDLELYARALERPASLHLSDEDWERLACGELPSGKREAALRHVARCAACAAICRGVLAVAAEATRFDPGAPRALEAPAAPAVAGWFKGGLAALAAGLALLAVSQAPLGQRPAPGSDALRSVETRRPQPLAPVGAQPAAPARFRWQAFPGAAGYRVELFDDGGRLVWSSPRLVATEVDRPAAVAATGGPFYWHVLALLGRSESDAVASPLVDFSIARGERPPNP